MIIVNSSIEAIGGAIGFNESKLTFIDETVTLQRHVHWDRRL